MIGILIFEALRGSSCVFNTRIGSHGNAENAWQEDWVDPLGELTRLAVKNGALHERLRPLGFAGDRAVHLADRAGDVSREREPLRAILTTLPLTPWLD